MNPVKTEKGGGQFYYRNWSHRIVEIMHHHLPCILATLVLVTFQQIPVFAQQFGLGDAPSQAKEGLDMREGIKRDHAIADESEKYPRGMPVVVYVWEKRTWNDVAMQWDLDDWAIRGSQISYTWEEIPPDSPYSGWRKSDITFDRIASLFGAENVYYPPQSPIPKNTTEHIRMFWTMGTGEPLEERSGVVYQVQPAEQIVKICEQGSLSVRALFRVDNRMVAYDLPAKSVIAQVWPDKGLTFSPANEIPVLGRTGTGYRWPFKASIEGVYNVIAYSTVNGAVLGSARVIVLSPTVKSISILEPAKKSLFPGESVELRASVSFEEDCVYDRIVTTEATWSSKEGKMSRNEYTAPPPTTLLAVRCWSHPGVLSVEPCEEVMFRAYEQFVSVRDPITVSYGGKASPPIYIPSSILPERNVTGDPSVTWSTGSPTFVATQSGILKVTAAKTVVGSDTVILDTATLTVREPTIESLEIRGAKKGIEVEDSLSLSAWALYKEKCLPAKEVTNLVTWTVTDNALQGNIFKAERAGNYRVEATYNGVTGAADIRVVETQFSVKPSRLSLRLDESYRFKAVQESELGAKDLTGLVEWLPDRTPDFKATRCDKFEKTAIHPITNVRASAEIDVSVDCIALAANLRKEWNSKTDPDMKDLSIKWLNLRSELEGKGCTCNVDIRFVAPDGSYKDYSQSPDVESGVIRDQPTFTLPPDFQGLPPEGTARPPGYSGSPKPPAVPRDAKVPPAAPGDYTWYAFCNPKTGEVTYGQQLPTGRKIMAGPFPGPRTAYDWIEKNCPRWRCTSDGQCATEPARAPGGAEGWYVLCERRSGSVVFGKNIDPTRYTVMAGPFLGEPDARRWTNQNCSNLRCDSNGICAKAPDRGGEWKVLCGRTDLKIYFGKTYDATKFFLVQEGFLGEPDARAWANERYPNWECAEGGAPVTGPRMGGKWAVVCSKQHGGVSLTQYPDRVNYYVWGEGFFGEPDARRWTDQNCPGWPL